MRTPASLAHRYLVLPTLGCALLFACGEGASKNDDGGAGAAANAGSGGASNGGTSNGGAPSGGASGTTASGGDTSNGGSGGATSGGNSGSGGTDSGGGGTSAGTDAGGTPSTGGDAGSTAGGTGGDAGSAGTAGAAGSGGSAGTPSAGCRAGGLPSSGRFMIDAAGTMREYIIKLPANYDGTHPYRLVLALHGRMYSAQTVADGGPPGTGASAGPYYGIEAASGGSAILVAPQALSTSWTNANDIPYIDAMVARFKSELCIDESRMFIAGFSMGAIMTLTYACAKPSTFRAIAPMSASLPASCTGDTPIAYFASHGTNDPTILYSSGQAVRDSFVARNGCTMQTMPGEPEGCVNYLGCAAGAPVTFCTFTGVHEPPPYAGEAIWAFLSQF